MTIKIDRSIFEYNYTKYKKYIRSINNVIKTF